MGKYTRRFTKLDERGLVSITVTIVFIMVISLTVLGFSQVTQRNSRQAVDRLLSSQAFYAAETGVNDVMNEIAGMVELGEEVPEQDECTGVYTRNNGRVYSGDDTIFYSCLLVDPTPDTLRYDNVGDGSVIVPMNATSGMLRDHTLTWQRASTPPASANVSKCQGPTNNRQAAAWVSDCPFGLLRVDVMPTNTTTLGNPIEAAKATMTVFLYPQQGGSVPDVQYENNTANVYGTGAPQGLVAAASCDGDTCTARLTNLMFANAYMRVRSLYVPTPSFQVVSESGTFTRSQVVIDATGKSQDVLRRIRVQLSITGSSSRTDMNSFSDYAIQSTDSLCKRFNTSPVFAQNYNTSDDATLRCP